MPKRKSTSKKKAMKTSTPNASKRVQKKVTTLRKPTPSVVPMRRQTGQGINYLKLFLIVVIIFLILILIGQITQGLTGKSVFAYILN